MVLGLSDWRSAFMPRPHSGGLLCFVTWYLTWVNIWSSTSGLKPTRAEVRCRRRHFTRGPRQLSMLDSIKNISFFVLFNPINTVKYNSASDNKCKINPIVQRSTTPGMGIIQQFFKILHLSGSSTDRMKPQKWTSGLLWRFRSFVSMEVLYRDGSTVDFR